MNKEVRLTVVEAADESVQLLGRLMGEDYVSLIHSASFLYKHEYVSERD